MSEALKPCPFCGHDTPEFERLGNRRQSCIVICGNCGCRHESSDEGERCGSSWNERATPAPDAAPEARKVDLSDEDIARLWSNAEVQWGDAIGGPPVHFIFARAVLAAAHGSRT